MDGKPNGERAGAQTRTWQRLLGAAAGKAIWFVGAVVVTFIWIIGFKCIHDLINNETASPVGDWPAAILAFPAVMFAAGAVHETARLFAGLAVFLLGVGGAIAAYESARTMPQLFGYALLYGVMVGVATISLVPFLREKRDSNR